MMLILAPLSASKSGARRCSGSWMAPVCVMTFTVTPANGFSCAWAGAPASAQMAETPASNDLLFIQLPPASTGLLL